PRNREQDSGTVALRAAVGLGHADIGKPAVALAAAAVGEVEAAGAEPAASGGTAPEVLVAEERAAAVVVGAANSVAGDTGIALPCRVAEQPAAALRLSVAVLPAPEAG